MHPSFFFAPSATLATFTLSLLPFAAAQALTEAEKPYVGGYTQGSVDSRAHRGGQRFVARGGKHR